MMDWEQPITRLLGALLALFLAVTYCYSVYQVGKGICKPKPTWTGKRLTIADCSGQSGNIDFYYYPLEYGHLPDGRIVTRPWRCDADSEVAP